MVRVRCWLDDCKFWKEGTCSSPEIEIYPDEGCVTMEVKELEEEEWEEEEEGWEEDEEEWEEGEE
jgi:hypothetical protein